MTIPRIDPNVKYKGTSYLRELNAETLRTLEGAIVIQGTDLQPLAVIVSMATYLAMQAAAAVVPLRVEHAWQEPHPPPFTHGPSAEELIGSDPPHSLDAVGPPIASGRGKISTSGKTPRANLRKEASEINSRNRVPGDPHWKGELRKPKDQK